MFRGLNTAISDTLRHWVGFVPDDVLAQIPAVSTQGKGDHPGDANEVFGFEAGLSSSGVTNLPNSTKLSHHHTTFP